VVVPPSQVAICTVWKYGSLQSTFGSEAVPACLPIAVAAASRTTAAGVLEVVVPMV
jgi:hypothetical protein